MASVLLKQDFSPNLGQDRSTVTELYHVYDILGWNDANTTTAVFAQAASGRDIGTSHPDIRNAILRNKVLRRRWTDGRATAAPTSEIYWQALVSVHYDSFSRETVFNPRSTTVESVNERVEIPYYYAIGNSPTVAYSYYPSIRARVRRVEVRHSRTAQVTEGTRNQIIAEVGRVYFFGTDNGPIIDPNPVGIPFLFLSPRIVGLSNGLTRLVYIFETTTPLRGIIAGTFGTDVPIVNTPSLGYLDEYVFPQSRPPVLVSRWYNRYFPGTGLPYL